MISFSEKIVTKNKIWNDIKTKKWEHNASYIWVIIKGALYKAEKQIEEAIEGCYAREVERTHLF